LGAAMLAGAAFMLVPINLGQSITAYVDSASGSAVVAWLAVTIHLRRLEAKRYALQALVLGSALGLMVGTKGTGLMLAALGSLALLAVQLGARSATPSTRAVLAWWLAVAACALVVGGFWYVRNFARGVSPIYPVGLTVAGHRFYPGYPYVPIGAY